MRIKHTLLILFILIAPATLWSLTGTSNERAAKAAVSPSYPVTPGDTYQISYNINGETYTIQMIVDVKYIARVPGFGQFDANSKTYYQLKSEVESMISEVFPGSVPVMTIINPGVFEVLVKGEVSVSQEIPAWSFERISTIVDLVKTSYTSYRDVEIISLDGSTRTIDLFLARRTGDMSQDPYLSFGDTIILYPYDRQIKLEGEVKRPGTYQMKESETLRDAVDFLGGGFTLVADRQQVQIKRYFNGSNRSGNSFYKDLSSEEEDLDLLDMDTIVIPRLTEYLPVIYLQGAVGTTEEGTSVSSKVTVPITEGEKLSSVVRKSQSQFTKVSDLEHVNVIRRDTGESITVNVEELLLTGNPEDDLVLSNRDMIVVPFRQYYVYVSGEVINPGRFPYIVNKTWEYYVNLAGGFDVDTHLGKKVKIYDVYGDRHSQKDRILQPEDVILAPRNHPMYWIGEYGGDLAVITAALTSTIIMLNYVGTLSNDNYNPIPTP